MNMTGTEFQQVADDRRLQAGGTRFPPRLHIPHVAQATPLQLFQVLFPMDFVGTVIVPNFNATVPQVPLTAEEFLKWLGLWLAMTFNKRSTRASTVCNTKKNQREL